MAANNQQPEVKLYVSGQIYGGWLTFSVARGIDAASGFFDLKISDQWPGQTKPWPIAPGDECQLTLGDETLITGYVDESNFTLTAQSRDLNVRGRDKTADLIDCSYIEKPDQWREADLAAIAEALAAPFGVKVAVTGGGTVKNFKVEPGETSFEAIDRLCKLKGLLVYPDGQGGLIIGPPGTESTGTTIKQEQAISINAANNMAERFSDYVVKGQRPTLEAGKDSAAAKTMNQTKDQAKDPGVKRYRPLLIVSEGAGAEAQERALWEAAARAGKGLTVEITLPGYQISPGGALWQINKLVSVSAPAICLADELLISQVKFDLTPASGHTTGLTLCRPDAYKPEPVKAPKGGGGVSGGLPPGTIVHG